jgi:hypothetical protein
LQQHAGKRARQTQNLAKIHFYIIKKAVNLKW